MSKKITQNKESDDSDDEDDDDVMSSTALKSQRNNWKIVSKSQTEPINQTFQKAPVNKNTDSCLVSSVDKSPATTTKLIRSPHPLPSTDLDATPSITNKTRLKKRTSIHNMDIVTKSLENTSVVGKVSRRLQGLNTPILEKRLQGLNIPVLENWSTTEKLSYIENLTEEPFIQNVYIADEFRATDEPSTSHYNSSVEKLSPDEIIAIRKLLASCEKMQFIEKSTVDKLSTVDEVSTEDTKSICTRLSFKKTSEKLLPKKSTTSTNKQQQEEKSQKDSNKESYDTFTRVPTENEKTTSSGRTSSSDTNDAAGSSPEVATTTDVSSGTEAVYATSATSAPSLTTITDRSATDTSAPTESTSNNQRIVKEQ